MVRNIRLIVFAATLLLFQACSQVADKPVDLVWPNPPEPPRIRYLRSLSHANEFGTSAMGWVEYFFGDEMAGTMSKPYAASTDEAGRVYVTDTGLGVVWVFDEKNKKVTLLGTSGQGQLKQPIGVAVDSRGIVFVSDVVLQRVYGLDGDGKLHVAIGKKGELKAPSGLAIDSTSNRLYVADTRGHNIRVYNTTDGTFLFEFGTRGKEEGEVNYPTNLFIRNGKLYVTDTGNFRIQIFDLQGKFVKKLGLVGDALGALARPKGVATDSEGHVYVVDAAFDNFQIFDEQGRLYLYVGSAGSRPGFFWLPAGIHIDEHDRIYVVDSYNRRVQVFQYIKYAAGVGQAKAAP